MISWDNQSVYGQGSTAQQPPQYYRQPPPPTQSHYHPSHAAHPASHRVVSQLDQLKKQIKDEYLRIQYNLNQQRLQEVIYYHMYTKNVSNLTRKFINSKNGSEGGSTITTSITSSKSISTGKTKPSFLVWDTNGPFEMDHFL